MFTKFILNNYCWYYFNQHLHLLVIIKVERKLYIILPQIYISLEK